MPKTLIDQARNKYREWQGGLTIHSSSVSNNTGMHLGKAFKTLVLPKYAALHGRKGIDAKKSPKDYTIPWHSNLADQIEKLIIDEVYSHRSNYPQETDAQKYETELKIQIAANRIAEELAKAPHSPYKYLRDHTKVSFELGTMISIGNGSLGTPVIDNFLRARAYTMLFRDSEIPQPGKNFEKNVKMIFRNIRTMDRKALEERYEELYQQHTSQLSAGGGASAPHEERNKVLNQNQDQQLSVKDFINLDNMSPHIMEYVYIFSNRLRADSIKAAKQNEVAIESTSRDQVRSFMRAKIFPDINDLISLFPECKATKRNRAVQGFEEDEKTRVEIQANEKSSLVVGLGRQSQALEEEDEKTREGRPSAQPLSVTSASRNPEMEARKRSEEDEVIEPKLNTKKTGETKSKFGVSNPFSSSGAKVGGEVRK